MFDRYHRHPVHFVHTFILLNYFCGGIITPNCGLVCETAGSECDATDIGDCGGLNMSSLRSDDRAIDKSIYKDEIYSICLVTLRVQCNWQLLMIIRIQNNKKTHLQLHQLFQCRERIFVIGWTRIWYEWQVSSRMCPHHLHLHFLQNKPRQTKINWQNRHIFINRYEFQIVNVTYCWALLIATIDLLPDILETATVKSIVGSNFSFPWRPVPSMPRDYLYHCSVPMPLTINSDQSLRIVHVHVLVPVALSLLPFPNRSTLANVIVRRIGAEAGYPFRRYPTNHMGMRLDYRYCSSIKPCH